MMVDRDMANLREFDDFSLSEFVDSTRAEE